MASVMEKVCTAEPIVSTAPKVKKEMEAYKELLGQSGLLQERVKLMGERQDELERLLDETGALVAQVRCDYEVFHVGPVIHESRDSPNSPVIRSVVIECLCCHTFFLVRMFAFRAHST